LLWSALPTAKPGGQCLPCPGLLDLPLATVFADVAGLREVGIVFPWLAREFLAVRPELAGWFSNLGWHGRNCGDGCGASPKAGVLNNLFDPHEFDVRLDSNNRAHGLRE
jgi:hypothetical protein